MVRFLTIIPGLASPSKIHHKVATLAICEQHKKSFFGFNGL
jgi:hypothetical protein